MRIKWKHPTDADLIAARKSVHGNIVNYPADDVVVCMIAREIMHTRIREAQMERGVQKLRWTE